MPKRVESPVRVASNDGAGSSTRPALEEVSNSYGRNLTPTKLTFPSLEVPGFTTPPSPAKRSSSSSSFGLDGMSPLTASRVASPAKAGTIGSIEYTGGRRRQKTTADPIQIPTSLPKPLNDGHPDWVADTASEDCLLCLERFDVLVRR
jgi:hypothetical protein